MQAVGFARPSRIQVDILYSGTSPAGYNACAWTLATRESVCSVQSILGGGHPCSLGRGYPCSRAAARAKAEPMGRSRASQLATVTRRSLQPPSCPPAERRRAGRDPPMKGTHRGRPASDPGAAAGAEAEPMERSAASQLATVTRRSLQPRSCPPSERRRAAPI